MLNTKGKPCSRQQKRPNYYTRLSAMTLSPSVSQTAPILIKIYQTLSHKSSLWLGHWLLFSLQRDETKTFSSKIVKFHQKRNSEKETCSSSPGSLKWVHLLCNSFFKNTYFRKLVSFPLKITTFEIEEHGQSWQVEHEFTSNYQPRIEWVKWLA